MAEITFLDVPYNEKDEAKKLGARWHPERKQWYIPAGINIDPFDKWLPAPLAEAIAPIYLLQSTEQCYQCQQSTPVFALAVSGFKDADEEEPLEEFVVLNTISDLPPHIMNLLKQRCPRYFIDYSKMTQSKYLMNHCTCGAKLGDFYMHDEPGGAFAPTSEYESRNISVTRIPEENNLPIRCSYSYTPDNPIKGIKPKNWA